MLAKVDFDGKEHIAIVLNSRMGLSWVLELRKNLVSFMETAFCSDGAMLDSNGTEKAANTKTCEISF